MNIQLKFFACFLLFIYGNLKGTNIDSLKTKSRFLKDTAQIDNYIQISRYYYEAEHNIDSMLKYSLLALKQSEAIGNTKRTLKTKRHVAICYSLQGKTETAIKYMFEVLKLAKAAKLTEEEINANNNLGSFYGGINQLDKSAYYFIESAKGNERIKDYDGMANCYQNLNVIFFSQKQYNKLIQYLKRTLTLVPALEKENQMDVVAKIYEDVAIYYLSVGNELDSKNMQDSAFLYAKRGLALSQQLQAYRTLANCYYTISSYYNLHNQTDSSIRYAKQALGYKKYASQDEILKFYHPLIECSIKIGKYELARKYLDTCYMYPQSQQLQNRYFFAQREYALNKAMGRFQAALEAHETFMAIKDSLQNDKVNATINELETKYQTEIKDAKIKDLSQVQQISTLRIRSLLFIILAIVAVLILILVFYRQSVLKNKQKTIETELRLNRARMDPHFFFNTLTSVQSLANKNNDQDTSQMIGKLSKIMRQTLESTYNELINIDEELAYLQQYVQLQQLRFPNKFKYDVELDPTIDVMEHLIPSMILQPFVENAIEHGFKNIDYQGQIHLHLYIEQNALKITLRDNGNFFSSAQKHKEYPSRATQIITDRLYLLEKQTHKQTAVKIEQDEILKGYKISLVLPLLLN